MKMFTLALVTLGLTSQSLIMLIKNESRGVGQVIVTCRPRSSNHVDVLN